MNELVRPVVVGLDGTEEALQAVRYGVHEAQRRGCGLRLVHAAHAYAPTAPMLPLISVDSVEEVGNRVVSSAAGLVYELTADQLPVEKIVRTGPPSHILAQEGEDACLVVLGRSGRSRLGRIFAGSTGSGVAGRARCPVVTVPSWWEASQRYGRVLVGVEHANHDQEALAVGFSAASERGAELTLLHAWSLQGPYDELVTRREREEWQQGLQSSIDVAVKDWRASYPEVPVRVEVTHQRAVEALAERSADVDLLVVGRHGHHAFREAHVGSVARTVMRESSCPVAVAPTQWRSEQEADDLALSADEISPQT